MFCYQLYNKDPAAEELFCFKYAGILVTFKMPLKNKFFADYFLNLGYIHIILQK